MTNRTQLRRGITATLSAFFIWVSIAGAAESTSPVPIAPGHPLNTQRIEEILGRSGETRDDVLKIDFPRTDLRVSLDGVSLKPTLALTSWAAFKPIGSQVLALGDLALREEEVKPVESRLKERGIEITALHNHLVGEKPRIIFLHFMGQGDAEEMANHLKEVLQLTKTPVTPPQETGKGTEKAPDMAEAKKIDEILVLKGKVRNGVIQYSLPRKDAIKLNGTEIPPFMGLATAINFQLAKNKTVTTGDFVLEEKEVDPVIHSLRENGIEVTALHNHLLNEEPRLFFIHFWGVGQATKLAEGLKKALDQIPH